MDIHRCRFIPYPASSINALAFSHNLTRGQRTPPSLRLALGRANGDIEIWNPAKGIWSQETVFRGGKNRSVEGLAWTQDLDDESKSGTIPGQLRLFSIGYSGSVTEWNLSTGMPLRHSSGNHAEVWSLAVQPRWRKGAGMGEKSEQLLAVGCADGSIVLHSTADDDLSFVKVLRRATNLKARILSLSFCDRNTVAAGCSDGTILIYDIRGKGKIKSVMHLGAGQGKASSYVWVVKYLSKNVLVSGDSTGELKFWDLKTFTVTQRLLCHDGDILTLASNAEGDLFFCGGMDRKTCLIAKDRSTNRWREVFHQKIHAGQVKAMASIQTQDLSIVISGGTDPSPVLLPLGSSGQENRRTLPGLPQSPPLISAPEDRLLVSWWDREVAFCEMNSELLYSMQHTQSKSDESELLQRILVQGDENVSSVSISRNGKLLAIATSTSCKIFVLSRRKDGTSARKIRRLESEALANCGARHVAFSPDGQWLLLIHTNNDISLRQILVDDATKVGHRIVQEPTFLERLSKSLSVKDPLGSYQSMICKITWSEDSRIVVCGDLAGNLDVWLHNDPTPQPNGIQKEDLPITNGHANGAIHSSGISDESEEEDFKDSSPGKDAPWQLLTVQLPRLPSSPLLLTFRPKRDPTLPRNGPIANNVADDRFVAITLRHEILEFHARTGRLTDWSKRNPSNQLPVQFRQIKDRVKGCVWDNHNERQRLWVYGPSFLFMFDMNRDLPVDSIRQPEGGLKRKRSNTNGSTNMQAKKTSGAGDIALDRNDFGLNTLDDDTADKMIKDRNTVDEESDEDDSDNASMFEGFMDEYNSLLSTRTGQHGDEAYIVPNQQEGEDADEQIPRIHTGPSFWCVYKYRPILGLVPLNRNGEAVYDDEEDGTMTKELEVALVERAVWDLDLDLPFL